MDPTKKLKTESIANAKGVETKAIDEIEDDQKKVFIKFLDPEGLEVGSVHEIPLNTKAKELEAYINEVHDEGLLLCINMNQNKYNEEDQCPHRRKSAQLVVIFV